LAFGRFEAVCNQFCLRPIAPAALARVNPSRESHGLAAMQRLGGLSNRLAA